MTIKKAIATLALSISFGTSIGMAQKEETIKTLEKETVFVLTDSLSSVKLLADKVEIKNLIRKEKKAREESLNDEIKEKEKQENLESPAEEIYGADSWVQSVNPIRNASIIPNTYDIDLKDFVSPIKFYKVNDPYGWRRRRRRMHHGIDLKLYTGEPVRAAFDGKVRVRRNQGRRRGYGKYYVIRHTNGLETVYGHLSKHIAKAGQIVKAGDVIGLGGNTGRSSGPHLHFEVRFCGISLNPQKLFDFAEGTARMDTYTFKKYKKSSHKSSSRYASKRKSSKGKAHYQIYRVRKGDNLGKIARRYHTTVSRLCKANHISRKNIIRAGDRLLIR